MADDDTPAEGPPPGSQRRRRSSCNPWALPLVTIRRNAREIKAHILKFCQRNTEGYEHVNITNYSSSWNNGMAFCALIHHFYPDAFDYNKLDPQNREYNFTLGFKVAQEKADIYPLLDVEDMILMGDKPDWKCVFTYVQSYYGKLRKHPRAR